MIRYVTAAPKTGSSFIAQCIAFMQAESFDPDKQYRVYPDWWWQLRGREWDLRFDMPTFLRLMDDTLSPGGAIYKGHFWANQRNLGVLDEGNDKYIVVLRSPADTLAAQFCSAREEPGMAWYNPIYRIDARKCVDIDEGINHLIKDGYLKHLLQWMADWAQLIDKTKGHLVIFESFLENKVSVLKDVASWADIHPCWNAVENHAIKTDLYYRDGKTTDANPEIYPKGWSGYKGVYAKYFNEEHIKAFSRVYMSMFPGSPGMKAINRLYAAGFAYSGENHD